jgi:hypothetical protein
MGDNNPGKYLDLTPTIDYTSMVKRSMAEWFDKNG